MNLRIDRGRRELIDRAAAAAGKSRTEFVLDAACREATAELLDRRLFLVDDETFQRFEQALSRPPSENPGLRRLMARKAPWEK